MQTTSRSPQHQLCEICGKAPLSYKSGLMMKEMAHGWLTRLEYLCRHHLTDLCDLACPFGACITESTQLRSRWFKFMAEAGNNVITVLSQSTIAEWIMTFGLIFGGCCSNAWALELATSHNPHAGSLITFAQFVLVSAYGLRKHITVASAPTAWRDVLRHLAAQLIHLRASGKGAAERIVLVALEGCGSDAFADELAREMAMGSHAQRVKRITLAGDIKEVLSQLRGLWELQVPRDTVVLVNGAHLHTEEFRTRWDYSVLLVSAQDIPPQGWHGHPSLTIDVSSQTHPIIVSPVPLNPLKRLARIRLKERSIPISRWAIQVALFLLTSLLNNSAFGYNVPMTVHIIFRSGGLVVNMLMGRLIDGRRYNATQVFSVILVTLGVVCTTLSASQPSSMSQSSPGQYYMGILILTLALLMSGFMGLAQDRAYAKYGRGHWQEAMFYLHFLALPGFAFVWRDLVRQVRFVNASARVEISLETLMGPRFRHAAMKNISTRRISVPSFYLPLILNVMTQLVCVSGVHRLTSRVNSLTVTLVLVVRKAVSLGISVIVVKRSKENQAFLWLGAGLVLAGTMGYAVGGQKVRNGDKRD